MGNPKDLKVAKRMLILDRNIMRVGFNSDEDNYSDILCTAIDTVLNNLESLEAELNKIEKVVIPDYERVQTELFELQKSENFNERCFDRLAEIIATNEYWDNNPVYPIHPNERKLQSDLLIKEKISIRKEQIKENIYKEINNGKA